ncbi:MAG: glycosyltransferase family 2 protein, partial [Chroococcales cyanobacterium]
MFFSIIIPTYNRRPILEKCLRALEQQKLRDQSQISGYEVIVIDDGSTDRTLEWL